MDTSVMTNKTKILSYEEFSYGDFEIAVDDVSVQYVQKEDCTENTDEPQVLTLSCRNNGCARFINIKTDNWSIENIDEFVKLLKDFKRRASLI